MQAGVFELNLSAAVGITDDLWVGASFRPNYIFQNAEQPVDLGPAGPGISDTSMDGFAPAALTLGVHYRVLPDTNLAFVYRSRSAASLSGEMELRTAMGAVVGTPDVESKFRQPDRFSIGANQHFLEDQLVVEAQFNMVMFGWLPNKTTIDVEGQGPVHSFADLKNVWSVNTGAEYWVLPSFLALRAGAYFGPEHQKKNTPNMISVYHGFQVTPGIGLGLQLGDLLLNASFGVTFTHGDDIEADDIDQTLPQQVPFAGRYEETWKALAGLSAFYTF